MTKTNPDPRAADRSAVPPDLGLPARLDMRRAFDIYVSGRGRTLGPGEKAALVGGAAGLPYAEPPAASPDPVSPYTARVPVPDELRFERGAGTWRQERAS